MLPWKEEPLYGEGMIGGILGLVSGLAYLAMSWNGPYSRQSIFDAIYWETFLWMGLTLLVGLFLFPRTVGMLYSPLIILLPVAFFVALFRHGFLFAVSMSLIAFAGWFITLLIGYFRPGST